MPEKPEWGQLRETHHYSTSHPSQHGAQGATLTSWVRYVSRSVPLTLPVLWRASSLGGAQSPLIS